MGCGSSTVADTRSHHSLSSKRARSEVASTGTEDNVEPETGFLVSKWIPGFAMDDADNNATIQTYEDYRGFTVTNANTASRSKTDKVCRWADEALEARAQHGGTFFNPNNPAFWPRDVLATYDTNTLFSNAHAQPRPKVSPKMETYAVNEQVTLSSKGANRDKS